MTVVPDDDGRVRCDWAVGAGSRLAPADSTLYRDYHDTEWGRPLHDSARPVRAGQPGGVPERAVVADHPAQAGELPPRLRPLRHRARRRATPTATSTGSWRTPGSCATAPRSRPPSPTPARRPTSTSTSASCCGRSRRRRGRGPPTCPDVPAVTPESQAMAKELKRRGFRFVGPTTAYALMQATGMVDDHIASCWVPSAG